MKKFQMSLNTKKIKKKKFKKNNKKMTYFVWMFRISLNNNWKTIQIFWEWIRNHQKKT